MGKNLLWEDAPHKALCSESGTRSGAKGSIVEQEAMMDVTKILEELRQEREQLEEAILSLERLARGRGTPSRTPASLDGRG
jgi:hypothetical protein